MNVWVTFHRSGITETMSGPVDDIEVRQEKHPGVDDVYLVTIGDKTLHLDADVAIELSTNSKVEKKGWSTRLLVTTGQPEVGFDAFIRLRPSSDFYRMLIASALILGICLWNLKRE